MNEEIEYAEMLEIPVSTVNLVKKKRRRKKAEPTAEVSAPAPEPPLKESVIAHVNEKMQEEPALEDPLSLQAQPLSDFADLSDLPKQEGHMDFDDFPQRVDTVRLYPPMDGLQTEEIREENTVFPTEKHKKGRGRVALNEEKASKVFRILFGTEFAVACALCGAIFITNAILPNSGINTFFRALTEVGTQTATADERNYSDFTLSHVVSDFSDAELNLSTTGVLTFQDACCVYPVADGTLCEVTQEEDVYTLKIRYSDSFTGVFKGLNQAYYEVGQEVKANLPLGYTTGEEEVQVTMYSNGELLNCFQVTEENCLAWVDAK